MRRVLSSAALVLVTQASGGAETIGPIGPEIVITEAEGGVNDAGVAGDDFGNFQVIWSRSGSHVARVDPAGTVSDPLTPTDDTLASRFRLAMQPDGDFVVTWWTIDQYGQYIPSRLAGRLFDGSGSPRGPEFQIHEFTTLSGYYASPAVAMDGAGNFVVVWDDYDESSQSIVAQRYDETGASAGGAFVVNVDTSGAYRPAVAMDVSGDFVVSWTKAITTPGPDDDIAEAMARRFDANGVPVGPDFIANQSTDGYQISPSVGADDAGGFVVTWESLYGEYPHDQEGVFARRFDSTAVPLADEFRVDTGTRDLINLSLIQVAVDPSGGFAVVWGSGDILARVYKKGGTKAGAEFQVNTYTPGIQAGEHVASSGTGEFLVTWSDYRGLIARRLGPPRVPTELRLTDNADPTKRKLLIAPTGRAVTSRFGRRIDPTVDGAFLHVYNPDAGDDSVCVSLPATGWIAKGADPTQARRFVYLDPAYANGPCAKVTVVNRKVVKARCRAKVHPIDLTLDEPAQGRMVVRLVSGSRAYCSTFGPDATLDQPGSFIGDTDLPAGECPPAPVFCP